MARQEERSLKYHVEKHRKAAILHKVKDNSYEELQKLRSVPKGVKKIVKPEPRPEAVEIIPFKTYVSELLTN